MRPFRFAIVALGAAVASPVAAQAPRDRGETVIDFAGNGGLRDWRPGPANSGIVYVRDRTNRWYRVQLTGPCITDRALDPLTYTTSPDGRFDRFSRVNVARYPNRTCGVASIRRNDGPPPDQKRPRRR